MGTRPWSEIENELVGYPGTRRRYFSDRAVLKIHIRDMFLDVLFYPLRFLPWGHVATVFWPALFKEFNVKGVLDSLSFVYLGDVMFWGKAIAVQETMGPYIKNRHFYKFPYWYLTRLIWPQFKKIRSQYYGN